MEEEEVYLPWLDKKVNWKDYVHNEIHLLVARVQGSDNLSEQIEHGDDFVERFKELIGEIIKNN